MPNYPSQRPVFLQSGDPADENRAADGYVGQLGTQFPWLDPVVGSKQQGWQLVKLDSAVDVAPSAGAVAWWRDATGYIVTTDVSVAGRGNVAGVFGGAVTVDYLCCIQQKGPAYVQMVASPTSTPDNTGKIVVPSNTDAKADVLAAGTAATYPPLGKCSGFLSGGLALVELDMEGRP